MERVRSLYEARRVPDRVEQCASEQHIRLALLLEPPQPFMILDTREYSTVFLLFLGTWITAVFTFLFTWQVSKQTQGMVLALIFLALSLLVYWFIEMFGYGKDQRQRRSLQRQFTQQTRQAKAIWQQLYYCHQCKKIFLPGRPTTASPEEIHVFY